MQKFNVGVIAAAGKGTRAYPRTTFIPKPLFQINGKSLLHQNIQLMYEKFGITTIYIIVGHLKEQVIEEVTKIQLSNPHLKLETSDWTKKGLASDIASLESKIKEPFITILGDEFYYKTNHEVFLNTFKNHPDLTASIGVTPTSILSRIRKNYSVELDGDLVLNLIEKPLNPPTNLLGLGSYLFTPKFFEFFKITPPAKKSGVIEITEVIDKMAKETKKVFNTMVKCDYYNINSMQDYHHAIYDIRNDIFSKFSVSLIVPTFNNERSISDILTDFQGKVNEIIVVDANSTDKTIQIAKEFKSTIERFEGSKDLEGLQIRKGFEKATGDILILVSPDGTYRAKDYLKFLEYLKDCDMVIGTRTTRQMIEQGSNLKPSVRLINLILGKIVEVFWWSQEPRFTDVDCKFIAIWKDSYHKILPLLESKDRVYIVEMMIEIVRSHMRCIEIPISYYKPVEEGSFSFFKSIVHAIKIIKLVTKKKWEDFFK